MAMMIRIQLQPTHGNNHRLYVPFGMDLPDVIFHSGKVYSRVETIDDDPNGLPYMEATHATWLPHGGWLPGKGA